MKRLMAIGFACAISAAAAMPTRKELARAQEMVTDVTSADVKALKAGAKKPAEVAAVHMELAGQSESEAEKYLLLQSAFNLYAKAGDYDSAANALEAMCRDIADMDYAASEVDPVRVCDLNAAWVCRQGGDKRFLLPLDGDAAFRLAVGPDLLAEKK